MSKHREKTAENQYIYGSAAPKMETARQYNERKGQKETSSVRAARRNQERAKSMNMGYVVFLTLATALIFGACALYIGLQADVNARMRNITSLESKAIDLKTDNDTTLKRLQTSVNLNTIKNKAMKKLGMVYPSEDQIVYYEVTNHDYMEQYDDIPENTKRSIFDLFLKR